MEYFPQSNLKEVSKELEAERADKRNIILSRDRFNQDFLEQMKESSKCLEDARALASKAQTECNILKVKMALLL